MASGRVGRRKADKANTRLRAVLLVALLPSLWGLPCFAGSTLQKTRDDLSRAERGNAAEVQKQYADGVVQSSLSETFEEVLSRATTAEQVFDQLDQNREHLRVADALAVLKKLLHKPDPRSRDAWQPTEPAQLTQLEDFKHLVTTQIEMVRKMNKFLAADVLIESAELGNQLLDLGMQDEGRQLLDSSLIAIEQALQPGELFRGGYGFLVADLPKILASLPGGHDPIRRRCLSAISSKARRLGPHSLLEVAHSLVESKDKLQTEDRELLRRVLQIAARKKHIFKGPQLADMLYSGALLNERDEMLLQVATRKAATNIGLFEHTDLAKLAFAVTRLDFRDQNFLGMLAQATSWKATVMPASTLSQILLCLGHFHFAENDLAIDDAVKQLKALLLTEELDPGVLSDALKGLAQLQHLDNEFLEASAKQLAMFTRQVQGTLARRKLEESEGEEVHDLMVGRDPTEVVSTAAAAMAALQYRSDHFMEAVHELVSEQAATFTFGGLANVLWSCAILESKPELSDLVAAAAVQLPEPLPADLVRMAWAFARLGKRDPSFIEMLKRQVEVIPRLDSFLLPDLAWALLKLQATDDAVLQKLQDQAGRVSKLDGMDWMTLILALRRANQADAAQTDGLLSRCAAQMTGKLPQQADSSILALDWLLQSVNAPEDAGRLRDAVATQVAGRRLDNSNLEKMFSDEGLCLRLPASESTLFATI
ncbi:unnamed protein product [Symbiodinium sp. KB8]|nr:unnamed protein product [Symbiodinium sp. KB8]